MVYAQQVEESRLEMKLKDARKTRSYEGATSKDKLEIQDNPNLKKRLSNQVPSNFPTARNDRVCNPSPQRGRGSGSPSENPTCGKYGKKTFG